MQPSCTAVKHKELRAERRPFGMHPVEPASLAGGASSIGWNGWGRRGNAARGTRQVRVSTHVPTGDTDSVGLLYIG